MAHLSVLPLHILKMFIGISLELTCNFRVYNYPGVHLNFSVFRIIIYAENPMMLQKGCMQYNIFRTIFDSTHPDEFESDTPNMTMVSCKKIL